MRRGRGPATADGGRRTARKMDVGRSMYGWGRGITEEKEGEGRTFGGLTSSNAGAY
jgi:hypothetical protein